MTSIPHYVYRWIDPRDNAVFYIGITSDLYTRFKQHMHCDGTNPQKDSKIQDIIASGHLPVVQTIEVVSSFEQALERESYWIHRHLAEGVALTNIAGTSTASRVKRTLAQRETNADLFRTFRYLGQLKLATTEQDARHATHEEFLAFARLVIPVTAEDGASLDKWTVEERRDFINWCLAKGVLQVEGDRLLPVVSEG